jgi:hypothetical protein
MDIDINRSLSALEAGIGLLPSAIVAVALLGGPTAVWLLYRYFVQPRTSRYRETPMGPIWICLGCQSANEVTSSRCYRCHREIYDDAIQVLDESSNELITLRVSETAPVAELQRRLAEPRPDTATGRRDLVAAAPAKPDVERPRRVVAARSAPKGSAARPRAKAQGASKPAARKVRRDVAR